VTGFEPGSALVTEALRRGARVVFDPPRFRGPAEAIALAQEAPEAAREILRRAVLFRAQLRTPGPVPILILPGAPDRPGGCLSCGIPVADRLRCCLCQIAAWLALDLIPPDGGDRP